MKEFSRTFGRAAAALVVAILAFVGPVSAATNDPTLVSQATQASSTISGQVTTAGGAGIAGAAVSLDGPQRLSTTTDASGNFSLSVAPGVYTITVNKGGFQSGSTQVVAAGGATETVSVALTESSLSNLQVIGRTAANLGTNAAKFNISSSPSATLSQSFIQVRDVPDLPKLVTTMPGIIATTNSSTNNSFFRIHGLGQETLVLIDGHPISSGVSGTFLGQFTDTGLLGGIDVLKGAGLNGPTAGESAVGSLNIRTSDFTAKDTAYLQGGLDNYAGSFYTLLANIDIGKFQFVLGKSFSGYTGLSYGQFGYGIVSGNVGSGGTAVNGGAKPNPTYTYNPPYLTNNLVAYQQPLGSAQVLNSQLGKVRYNFSNATSIAFEFFGTQSTILPEGYLFAQFLGFATPPNCLTGGKAAGGASCGQNSAYNSPFVNVIGAANTPLYTFFPATNISNNNPNFNLDFKTTIKNDTLLLRPYTATIERLTDATQANRVYGNGNNQVAQGSYAVTNNANCQVQFIAPTAAGGAKGPCYQIGGNQWGPAFVGALPAGTLTAFPTTTTPFATACSVAAPCFTSPTQQSNSGVWGFGTPSYSQEVDKLAGYTFSYIHPVGANIYNFSIDHYYNDTVSYVGDPTPLAAGCTFTQSGGPPPKSVNDPGYQAGCTLIGPNGTNAINYKATPLSIPDTFQSVTSFALTAQFQITPKLEFDFGNYLTQYTIWGQQESPAFLNAFTAAQTAAGDAPNAGLAPIVLTGFVNSASHYDPHFGFVWRPQANVAVRLTGGSSISVPYASLVSGLTTPTSCTNGTCFTVPAPNLLPEIVVAEDIGSDYRLKNGTVFSLDLFNDFVHNTWLQTNVPIPAPPGYPAGGTYLLLQNLNGAGRWSRGFEFTAADMPQLGLGYSISGTFNRLSYVNLPASFLMLGTYTPDGAQDYGQPYTKGYANIQWAMKNDSLVRFGADYEGPGNPANSFAYFQYDAGIRIGFTHPKGLALQAAAENLTNFNPGAVYAHAIGIQGITPVNQTLHPDGTYTYNNGPTRGLSAPLPLTVRFGIIYKL